MTPASIFGSSLTLWLRSDMGVTIATGVSSWLDQSGKGDANRNVAQAVGANQPTFNASDAGYAGKPTLSFAAASSQNLKSGIWNPVIAQPFSTFFVGNDDGSATNQGAIDGLSEFANLNETNEGAAVGFDVYSGVQLNSNVARSSSPRIYGADFAGVSSSTYVSAITATNSGNAGAVAPTGMTVGSWNNNTTFWNGKIVEIVVVTVTPTLAQRTALLRYFGARYGITVGA